MFDLRKLLCCLLLATASAPIYSQPPSATNAGVETTGDAVLAQLLPDVPSSTVRIPAGTEVTFEIAEEVSSKTSRPGDSFPIRLVAPLVVDRRPIIPIGSQGVGEVVHAAKARAGGKAGELILAARYIDYRGTHIPLRRFHLGGRGLDNSSGAGALAAFGGLTGGVASLIISGGNMVVPTGTLGRAIVAADVDLPAQGALVPVIAQTTLQGE